MRTMLLLLRLSWLIFSANQLPATSDKTPGFFRRWIICEFTRELVENPNQRLAAQLLEEKSGIFNWMLEGAKRLMDKGGFTYPTNPEEMAKRYISRSEPITEFLAQCCQEDFDGEVEASELFRQYTHWSRIHKRKKMSQREFTTAMKNQTDFMVEYRRDQRDRENRIMKFFGINLGAKAVA